MITAGNTLSAYIIPDISNENYPHVIHDHSVAVYQGGLLLHYLHHERINKNKYDSTLQNHLIYELRDKKLLQGHSVFAFVDHVIGRAIINRSGNIRFEAPLADTLFNHAQAGRLYWLNKNHQAFAVSHELAHVYSSVPFYGAFKDNSLLLQFDGGASKGNYSLWLYRNNMLTLITHGWELKYLSGLFNANALVFAMVGAKLKEQNSVPGKFMGLASYGTPDKKLLNWLKAHGFFADVWSSKKLFFEKLYYLCGIRYPAIDNKKKIIQDLASTIHRYFVDELLCFLERKQVQLKADYLYYTGGSALNIEANAALLNSGLFSDVFVPPCAGDSGLSIGAGALLEETRGYKVKKIPVYINNWGIGNYRVNYSPEDIRWLAERLMENKVFGLCNGYAECGPRALGNRSIIALANSRVLAGKVSREIKMREWYRPVAPVMLEENTRYFTELTHIPELSRFMLMNFNIVPEKRPEIEGVVHADGTSRIQTVFSREDNSFLFDLLRYLDTQYGVKALINTSFNAMGEPIIHTTDDAVRSAKKMKLDGVVLNGKPMLINKLIQNVE